MREAFVRHRLFLIIAVSTPLVFAGIVVWASTGGSGATRPTAKPRVTVPGVPRVDYVLNLPGGVMTPLPEAIIRTVARRGDSGLSSSQSRYAASADGSLLAYVGNGAEGSRQIFMASIDGRGVRQMTHDSTGAQSPALSPDGTSIAYVGYGDRDVGNLFMLDVATGATTQMTAEPGEVFGPQFTPDGSALVYTTDIGSSAELRTVPVVAPGKSTRLIGAGGKLRDARNGSLSPDGSLVTFLGSETGRPGPQRWLANADGTQRRLIPGWFSNPAGTWSPDGSRIVCSDGNGIIVVDIATGDVKPIVQGSAAIWLNWTTLLVEV